MSKVEYKNTRIKDIGRVVTGKTPETQKAEFYGDGYMFITPTELHDGYNVQVSEKYITELGLQSIKSNCIDGTSVLIGCIGWDMGNVAICHRKCATNQQINSITDFNPKYNPFYTYYWLLTKKDYLFTIASVTRTPILSKSIFEEIVIPMPDRSIQDNVVGILKSIDDKIENNKKICFELEFMAKTLYDYWFVQFDFPDENGKPYRTSGGEMIWNEQLKREIPKEWKVKSLGKIIIENEKSKVQVNNAKNCKGNYPFFTSGDTILRWNKAQVTGRNCFLNTGGNADVKYYVGEAAYSTDTWCITSQNGFEDYLYLLLLSYKPIMNRKFFQGTGLKHLQKPLLKAEKICIPNDIVLKKYNKKIQNIFPVISNIKRENEELIKLRDWLLPMLMNGQARVE